MSETQNYVKQIIEAVYDGPLEVKGSASIITIKVSDREMVKKSLYAYLDKNKIKYADTYTTKSSFNVTELSTPDGKKIQIVYKNMKAGGSGAGAEVTELAESAQCWYTAIAFSGKKLESQDDFLKLFKTVSSKCDTDATIEKIIKNLPDDWIESSIKIANHMKNMKEFSNSLTSYEFHRGSSTVNKINEMFLLCNRKEKLFANINKWTPADIWVMTQKGKSKINESKADSFAALNTLIAELYISGDVIGVSLKKVGKTVKSEIFNFGSNKIEPKFKQYKITDKSKDGYIIFSYKEDQNMQIQFRSFTDTGSWQGEIKGKYASGGKIGGGQVAEIIKRVTKNNLSSLSAKDITKRAQMNDPTLVKEMVSFAKDINLKLDASLVSLQKADWRFSKYLTVELFSKFLKLKPSEQGKILSEIIGYSSSATENSAIFIKIS